MRQLRGITWDHTRGFLPKVASAQRYHELHPQVQITWQTRSLQDFADYAIEHLVREFDLLIIDHPSIGEACQQQLFLPLNQHLPAEFLADQAANSVGASHASYQMQGQQWALAVDAATPVASWRADFITAEALPRTWEDLLQLARAGHVALPAIPIDSLMHLYMLCLNQGEAPCQQAELFCSDNVGLAALDALHELVSLCGKANLARNPIQTYQAMTQPDTTLYYCPFAYGYANYSRPGYGSSTLQFGPLVSRHGQPLRSTLGGAGLAISAYSQQREIALDYAQFMASAAIQCGLFPQHGGQPGYRQAWLDAENHRVSRGYFQQTLSTLDQAWVRPRYPGYIAFQQLASASVHRFLQGQASSKATLNHLNQLHRKYAHEAA